MDWTRRVVTVTGVMGAVGVLLFATGAAWFWQGGLVSVRVKEHGPHGSDISLTLPGAPLQAFISFVPDECFDRGTEMRRVAPILKELSGQLRRLPDCVLIDVEDRGADENVRIAKRGGNLVIDVQSPKETVHISMPIRLLGTILNQVGSSADDAWGTKGSAMVGALRGA